MPAFWILTHAKENHGRQLLAASFDLIRNGNTFTFGFSFIMLVQSYVSTVISVPNIFLDIEFFRCADSVLREKYFMMEYHSTHLLNDRCDPHFLTFFQ